ncbi:MAG: FAD-dependent oxidoreductase [Candidatus Thorarchaeota archaeon]|nr:FAD-dependent oxidoreductase [Candidatus Thorarchaeota archaeon]
MSEEKRDWELVVVGGGPAGMTAAIYGGRYGLDTLLLEAKVLGGAQATSPGIENYPGFVWIKGIELAERMKEQVRECGAKIKEITEVDNIEIEDGNGRKFTLETQRGNYTAEAIIIATGGGHKTLGLPGEEQYTGRGVSYCATCDGPLFRDRTVAVIGGGNTAATEAVYLSEITSKTYMIHRRDELRAEHAMERALMNSDVDILWDTIVKEFRGNQVLEEILIENVETGEQDTLEVNGAFVALGSSPNSEIAQDIGVETNDSGEILVTDKMATNVKGVFAAGDVVDSLKQIAVAVGHGAIAADSAYAYIRHMEKGPR